MTQKEKHLLLRNKKFDVLDIVKPIFNDEELKLLHEYGTWMEGLLSGEIEPITDKQSEFISCIKNDTPPQESLFNIYWRYIKRKELSRTTNLVNEKKLIKDDREDWKKMRNFRF